MQRRAFIGAALAALSGVSAAAGAVPSPAELETIDLDLPGDRRIARRARLLVPRHTPPKNGFSVLVLLHGLGETAHESLGLVAWSDRYGLVDAYRRLRNPPVGRTLERERYLDDARAASLNASLEADPFRGLVLVCPVTPNPEKRQPARETVDRYAAWLEGVLLPEVRARAGVPAGAKFGLDGCSLGGAVALEVFLRKPDLFQTFGGVQAAISPYFASRYARRIAGAVKQTGPHLIHIETSSLDPYREANELLSRQLTELGVPNDFTLIPGPHDQPWLREIGTVEMLLWHARHL